MGQKTKNNLDILLYSKLFFIYSLIVTLVP